MAGGQGRSLCGPPTAMKTEALLRLLGGIDWSPASGDEPARLGRKPAVLLATAAANGARGVSRERLAAMLYPGQDAHSGAAALRQCLHHLRKSLGPADASIDAGIGRIAIRREFTDVDAFERAAARGDAASLALAARLYQGDFAEGIDPDDDEITRWIEAERLRLRALAQDVLGRLAACETNPQTNEVAVGLAHRLLARDPVHEGCYRSLMLLLERAGMSAEALRAYERCKTVLREQIGIEPSAETAALARRIWNAARAAGASETQAGAAVRPGSSESVSIGTVLAHAPAAAAADHCLRAWNLFTQFSAKTNRQARIEVETALGIAPSDVTALVLLGWTHFFDWIAGWVDDPRQSYLHCCEQARRAFAVPGERGSPHQLQAKLMLWTRRHDEALEHARKAVAIEPTYGYAHFNLADVLSYCGKHDEALDHIRYAMAIEPVEFGVFKTIEAFALFLSGSNQQARESVESALTRNPGYPWAHGLKAAIDSELGNFEAARAAAKLARSLCPRMGVGFDGDYWPLLRHVDRDRLSGAWARIGEQSLGEARAEIVQLRPARRRNAHAPPAADEST